MPMITVRFPTGFSVQYNSLKAMKWSQDNQNIYLFESIADRDKGGGWQVSVPAGCIVEFTQPCRTYDASTRDGDQRLQASIESLAKEMRSLKRRFEKKGAAR
jgi:hypothetical protein